jgi:hypothetical protein
MLSPLLPVLVFGGLLIGGFTGTFWPALIHSLDTENDSASAPSPDQLWKVRIGCIVMFLMGCVGIYAVLTWDGTPPDGPLF